MTHGIGMTLAEAARACGAKLHPPSAPAPAVAGVSIDTRTLARGDVFVALPGERADGHSFVANAAARGAAGAIVSARWASAHAAPLPLLIVHDPLDALQDLARAHRRRFRVPVVAVTGSSGKTTTKEMVSSVLSSRFHVHRTPGNLNNQIGVPLALLGIRPEHEVAVIEMGMNHRGEIESLSLLASPDVSLITNIGRAHVGLLGSVREVALAKLEIVRGMVRGGTLILPCGEPLLDVHPAGIRVRTFGRGSTADVAIESCRPDGLGRLLLILAGFPPIHLRAAGDGNALNAAAAAAAGLVLGVPRGQIAAGLERFQPLPGRLAFTERSGITFIEDHYNANPDSFRVALEVLLSSRARGRRIAVIGEMLEQGEAAAAAHEEVGRAAAGADAVLSVGEHAGSVVAGVNSSRRGHPASVACGGNSEAARALMVLAKAGDIVLVKGSRGARLEEILAAFPED